MGMPRKRSLDRDELEAGARTALLVRRSDLPVPLAHPARSFFGGLPKLPRKIEWPRGNLLADSRERETVALTFIAQIDLSELPDFEARPYLPHVGTLFFLQLQLRGREESARPGYLSPGQRGPVSGTGAARRSHATRWRWR
jgi:hypothetical protein